MNAWDTTTQPVQPVTPVHPVREEGVLDQVRDWLERFITVIDDSDLDLLTLWAAHTHVAVETYTTPRLVIDSPVPGSGKTTVLEHLERLCMSPIQMASLSSPALLTRMLDKSMRTILIDEADRSLSPNKDGVEELLAVLNSGYKRGGSRPVLISTRDGWEPVEMPTYSPVAMAGNSPDLPEDTKSRSIRVLLMPDHDGSAEESDWELYDEEARELGQALAGWADSIRDLAKVRPALPDGVKGRARERWGPLKRVAVANGGRWPAVVDRLALQDVEDLVAQREEGITIQRPHVILLGHIAEVWPRGEKYVRTEELIRRLIDEHPKSWSERSSYGRDLTPQRLGRMLVGNFKISSSRQDTNGPRGYYYQAFETAFRRFGVPSAIEPDEPAEPARPDGLGLAALPGRCSSCEWHLDTQGHAPTCAVAS
jgi:hypothetical protein